MSAIPTWQVREGEAGVLGYDKPKYQGAVPVQGTRWKGLFR